MRGLLVPSKLLRLVPCQVLRTIAVACCIIWILLAGVCGGGTTFLAGWQLVPPPPSHPRAKISYVKTPLC